MTILFAASEVAPDACTGGLGEVLAALPRYVAEQGHETAVVLPGYPPLMEGAAALEVKFSLAVGDSLQPVTIFERTLPDGTQVLLIHNDALFGRPGIYGHAGAPYEDNALRFVFFSRAVVELARRLDPKPDILHLHDWQTALVPVLVREQQLPFKTVLTLHNLSFQGSFPASSFAFTNLPARWMSPAGLEFYGAMNLLKGGILHADLLTTVSETYRRKILTPEGGCGLHSVLQSREAQLHAVPNGVDPSRWSPELNSALGAPFSAAQPQGKSVCRAALVSELGLGPAPSGPVFAMLGRLADQKGFDLLLPLLPRLCAADVRVIIAGDGASSLRKDLLAACRQHPQKLAYLPSWDPNFPQRLLAGADILLVPSHFEPCGLAALQGLAGGALPIAHATGGLLENLRDFDPSTGEGNAILYHEDSIQALWDAISRAQSLFRERNTWGRLLQNALESEFSWEKPAAQLGSLYSGLDRRLGTTAAVR
jgi:starch synthase